MNAAYAPAIAVAASSVRSRPAIPRMSYSRKMFLESDIRSAGRNDRRRFPSDVKRASLRERHQNVREQAENENHCRTGPDNGASPSSGASRKYSRARSRLHEHHHHHIQVVTRTHNAGENEYDRKPGLWSGSLQCGLENVPLGEKPDPAEYREAEQSEHEDSHRHRKPGPHVPESGILLDSHPIFSSGAHGDDYGECTERGHGVGKEVEHERRATERGTDDHRDQDISRVRDARVCEQTLDITLRQGDQVADNHGDRGQPP